MGDSTGGNGRASFHVDIQSVSINADEVVYRAVLYLTSSNVDDDVNNLSIEGNWSRSGALDLNGVYNDVPVWFQDVTFGRPPAGGPGTFVEVRATWSNVEWWGGTLFASQGASVPPKDAVITVPGAPTITSITNITPYSARVIFAGPSDSGGSAIINYFGRLHRNSDGAILWEGWVGTSGVWDIGGLSPNVSYTAFVLANNAAGNGPFSNPGVWNTLADVPGQATPPGVDSVTSNSARLVQGSATANGSAITLVNYQVSTNGGFTALVSDSVLAVPSSPTATNLPSNTVLYARERFGNGVGWGSWSAATAFTTKVGTPGTPTFPAADLTSLTVAWTGVGTSAGTVTYEVQISPVSNFASGVISQAGLTSSPTTFTGLSPATTYYARVRATSAQGTGSFSATASAQTIPGVLVKVGGTWRNGVPYIKRSGVWVAGTPYIKSGGQWKT